MTTKDQVKHIILLAIIIPSIIVAAIIGIIKFTVTFLFDMTRYLYNGGGNRGV